MTTDSQILQPTPPRRWTIHWSYGLFWSWNLIFVAFMLFGFAPSMLPDLIRSVQSGAIPPQYLVNAVILVSVPVSAILLGLTVLRRAPHRLFALGYAVEGPLMLLLLIRLFVVREATLAVNALLIIAFVGMAAFVWQLLDRRPENRPTFVSYLKLAGLTLFLMLAVYASIWVAFYALPLLAWAARLVYTFLRDALFYLKQFWGDLVYMFRFGQILPLTILGFILGLYTATLFVLMPIAVPILAVRAWLRALRLLPGIQTRRVGIALSGATFVMAAALFVLAAQQPQHRAFALLADPPQTREEMQVLLRQQDTIRTGLLNAYLAPVRYLSAVGNVGHIHDFYSSAFKMPSEQARKVQAAYEFVARPLLYEPVEPPGIVDPWQNQVFQDEPAKAAQLYERYFDEPIYIGERDTVVRAVRSTWNGDQALAAWQAIDDREIHLVTQEVNISEHGDWAEIELFEAYQNQTGQMQEVVYYFSLPESAVLTGLWLNDRPDRATRYKYVVAPRGAAQAIYRNEKVVRRDPALLEQVGPRQYRLRVFPIQPQRWINAAAFEDSRVEAPLLYLWMTFRVMAQDNAWPLPQVAEVRNVYWDAGSQRQVAGQPFSGEDWLPRSIPASAPVSAAAHRFDFPNGETVLAQPLDGVTLPALPEGLNLAVVVDRSRSMARYTDEVQAALAQLAGMTEDGTGVDVYLTSSIYRGEPASVADLQTVRTEEIVYFGGQNASELLAQYNELRQGKTYDAVLVLTDGSGYDLGASAVPGGGPDAPFWMVHLNEDFPLGYDDDTLEAIQASGGGVAGSLDEALTRIAFAQDGGQTLAALFDIPQSARVDVIDGYAWLAFPTGTAGTDILTSTAQDDFGAFAARWMILAEMQRNRGNLSELATLDDLHALAVEHHVVTPYSSMIVLVNMTQRNNLEKLEGQADRFEREFEGSGDTVPQAFSVTGVPEPEEWLLLALVTGMLAWYYRGTLRRKLQTYRLS